MAEVSASVVEASTKKKKAKKRRKIIRTVVFLLILAAVGAAVFFAMKKFLFPEEKSEILRDYAMFGSISNTVEGYGYTKSANSESITLAADGVVQEVYVMEGDFVEAGTPLYKIDATAAREILDKAEQTVAGLEQELAELKESYGKLSVRPPFAGRLENSANLEVGGYLSSGMQIASVVDDSRMLLPLYFSYTYENEIAVGQTATVSVPASMAQLDGTVEKIDRVRFVTPEGAVCFRALIAVPNPGTLTGGMGASAYLLTASGERIYPYDSGKLDYYRSAPVIAEASGKILSVNLLDFSDAAEDTVLVTLGPEEKDAEAERLEADLAAAREKAETARADLANFEAVAPISGTVISCGLIPGEEVKANTTSVIIADNSVMTVDINVDERSIGYVKMGMYVALSDWYGNFFNGTVTNISLTGNMDYGATTFPVTIRMENPNGTMMSNMSINYSFQASQVDWCLMVPVQSVKNVSDAEGNPTTVVFVERDKKPDNAIELPEELEGVPSEAEGFYAVPVELGISDTYHVEILSGLEDGDTVFTSYLASGSSYYG